MTKPSVSQWFNMLVLISILTFGIILFSTQQTTTYKAELLREVEFRIETLAINVNDSFQQADSLLRFIVKLLEVANYQEITEIERFFRQELLLHPEIYYLRMFDSQGNLLWRNSFAPSDNLGFDQLKEHHISKSLDFVIAENSFRFRDDDILQVSRSLRDQENNLRYIVEVGMTEATLFPGLQNTFDAKISMLTLRTLDFLPLLSRNYNAISDSINIEAEQTFRGFPSENLFTGTFFATIVDSHIYARYQLVSFPYYLTMVMDVSNELRILQNRIALSLTFLALVALVSWFLVALTRQRKKNKTLFAEKQDLEHQNIDLEKTSEERKLLIQEVHHRVKNNLALVNSIINLMILEGGPFTEHGLNDLSARITAIQKVHETLYLAQEFSEIVVATYLEEITKMILSSTCAFPVNLKNDIDFFRLSTDQIIPLGILVAELITNAVKYGLEPGGTLGIEGNIDSQKYVTIIVRNDGKPYRESSPGLGSQLIAALSEQLGGTIGVETEPFTSVVLRFPWEEQF